MKSKSPRLTSVNGREETKRQDSSNAGTIWEGAHLFYIYLNDSLRMIHSSWSLEIGNSWTREAGFYLFLSGRCRYKFFSLILQVITYYKGLKAVLGQIIKL